VPRPVSLSFDLLLTFVRLMENDGDASQTARLLKINQPSMSKRLRYLQLKSPVLPHPWLVREGKTWKLTPDGERALPAVRDLIGRYEQLVTFVGEHELQQPDLTFACGRESSLGFVRDALLEFRRQHPRVRLRICTMRGASRIEGVANGALDLATVSHDPASILEISRRDLYIEPLVHHRLALICRQGTEWAGAVEKLPKTKVPPTALVDLPLIIPDQDAGIRRGLDDVFRRYDVLQHLNIALEVGGWAAIMAYVAAGVGIGIISEAAVPEPSGYVLRFFDPAAIPPIATRLICRREFSTPDEKDLTPDARAFAAALRTAAKRRAAECRCGARESQRE
jgi:LysR family positive regulator for ilvC